MAGCALCTLAVHAGLVAEESVEPRSWVGSTFVIERDEFTDAFDYKVIVESDRATVPEGREGAFVMFTCSGDAKWESGATSARQPRLRGFTGGIAVLDDVARTRRSGVAAEYLGPGFDVRTRVRVDDEPAIGPGMWPTVRSAEGLNTIIMPNALAVRLAQQIVRHGAERLIADTGSGYVHRFDLAGAKPDLRDWVERCDPLRDQDTRSEDQDVGDVNSEPHELVESRDESSGERRLSLTLWDQRTPDMAGHATLLFSCREHVERGYRVLLGVTRGVMGVVPNREGIDGLAARLGEPHNEVEYYRRALAAYAEIFGTGETAVVVPVQLRFDTAPARVLTWWWSEHGVARGASSLIGGGAEVLAEAVVADQATARIQESRPFTFDLVAARPKLGEFVSRCEGWWDGLSVGEVPRR